MAYGNRAPGEAGISGAVSALEVKASQLDEGTGWRNIISLLSGGATATKVHIRRQGDRVTVLVRGLAGNGGAGAINWITGLPVGFRALSEQYAQPLATSGNFTFGQSGSLGCIGSVVTSTGSDLRLEYIAGGTFPTTGLPGVAV